MFAFMLFVASVASNDYRLWAENTPQQGTDREIVLVDVRLFRITYEQAYYGLRWCRDHQCEFREQVKTWNKPLIAWQWSDECHWRERCWLELCDAMDPKRSTYNRVSDLYRLRDLLGREAFYAGVMPSPTPNYKFLPNR